MPKTMHCQDLDKIGIFRCVEWIPGFGSLSIYWEFHIDQPPPVRYLVFHLDAITYSTIVVLCTFSPDDPIPRVVFGRVCVCVCVFGLRLRMMSRSTEERQHGHAIAIQLAQAHHPVVTII